jgi:hypothetical protein
LCDGDIAVLLVDEPIVLVKPLAVRARGPARGEHLRAVSFGRLEDGAPREKLVREHVRVGSVTEAELEVGEASCREGVGGAVLDEDTGEIVGVLSRGGPSCEGADVHNVYSRVDAWTALLEQAFTRAAEVDAAEDGDEVVRPVKRGTKQKPASDVGGPCDRASDCGAGICVYDADRQYCSRTCGSGDRCPTKYRCEDVSPSGSACVQSAK